MDSARDQFRKDRLSKTESAGEGNSLVLHDLRDGRLLDWFFDWGEPS